MWGVDKRFTLEPLCFSSQVNEFGQSKWLICFTDQEKIVKKHNAYMIECCLLFRHFFLWPLVVAFFSFLTKKIEVQKVRKKALSHRFTIFCHYFCFLYQCFQNVISSVSHWHSWQIFYRTKQQQNQSKAKQW